MPEGTSEPKASLWKRLLVEPSTANAMKADQRPVFLVCAALSIAAGILGWAIAALYPTWFVPILSLTSVLGGLLGVRSRWRSIALIGFVMGMFLLPRAVSIAIALFNR